MSNLIRFTDFSLGFWICVNLSDLTDEGLKARNCIPLILIFILHLAYLSYKRNENN